MRDALGGHSRSATCSVVSVVGGIGARESGNAREVKRPIEIDSLIAIRAFANDGMFVVRA